MKVLGLIPARYESSRFPGKPLADVNGKSMVQCVCEQVSKVESLSAFYVATDDKRIEEHIQSFGGKVVMTSRAHLSGTDRCAEAVKLIEGDWEVVINIQGDEPFIDPRQIDQVAGLFVEPAVQIGTLAKTISADELDNPNAVKVLIDAKGFAIDFRRLPLAGAMKHIGIYGYRAKVLQAITWLPPSEGELAEKLEQLRWLENGYRIKVGITELESIAIDTPEDLEKVRKG